jgi:hypothetical protein
MAKNYDELLKLYESILKNGSLRSGNADETILENKGPGRFYFRIGYINCGIRDE